jgi:phosphomethylpyrimidine synthase
MKITQEVRDFAAKQNSPADTFLAADVTAADADRAKFATGATLADAEQGMADMSEKFRAKGSEIYLPAE